MGLKCVDDQILVMIQEGLRVAVPLKDKTRGVVAVEVQLVLQSPGVFRTHQFRAFRGETLQLVKLGVPGAMGAKCTVSSKGLLINYLRRRKEAPLAMRFDGVCR